MTPLWVRGSCGHHGVWHGCSLVLLSTGSKRVLAAGAGVPGCNTGLPSWKGLSLTLELCGFPKVQIFPCITCQSTGLQKKWLSHQEGGSCLWTEPCWSGMHSVRLWALVTQQEPRFDHLCQGVSGNRNLNAASHFAFGTLFFFLPVELQCDLIAAP